MFRLVVLGPTTGRLYDGFLVFLQVCIPDPLFVFRLFSIKLLCRQQVSFDV